MEHKEIKIIYKLGTTEIKLVNYSDKVAIAKVYKFEHITDLNQVIKEVEAFEKASMFKKALTYYGSEISQSGKKEFWIYMEYCPKKDLSKFIKDTKKPFQESIIWKHCKEFIELFAYLQSISICHRDIKPENIFVTEDEDLRVGDFGEAKEGASMGNLHTLRGSPFYLSPELFANLSNLVENQKISYNPFKSDVFSLGLVLLVMSCLQPLSSENNWRNRIPEKVGMIKHPALRTIVFNMVIDDKALRPDFLVLDENVKSMINRQICCLCLGKYLNCQVLECSRCDYSIHLECGQAQLSNMQCFECHQLFTLREIVEEVNNHIGSFEEIINEESKVIHHKEEKNDLQNNDFKQEIKNIGNFIEKIKENCNDFDYPEGGKKEVSNGIDYEKKNTEKIIKNLEKSQSIPENKDSYIIADKNTESNEVTCSFCHICHICFYRNASTPLGCITCERSLCSTCKMTHFPNQSCINDDVFKLKCVCEREIYLEMSQLFYTCPLCGIRCRVCSKQDVSISHKSCADALNKNNN